MIGGRGSFTPSQTNLQVYNFYTMAVDTENAFIFEGGEVHFLVFDAAVADASESIELYKLPFARNLITRPDALAQVGGLLSQITRQGGPPQNSASPMQKYIVAKTDALKVELLQKPVSGQPQMVQLVPASKLEAGVYSLFAVRVQGGQRVIIDQLFELKSGSEAHDCIDLAVTGGAGGAMEANDARMTRPYYLAKEGYVACGASGAGSSANLNPPAAGTIGGDVGGDAGACNDYGSCFQNGLNAFTASDWQSAIGNFRGAIGKDSTKGDAWAWLGRAYLANGRIGEFAAAWDRAIGLGVPLILPVCHEKGFMGGNCEQGDLTIGNKQIFFGQRGQANLFSVSPSEVTPKGVMDDATQPASFFILRVTNKRYNFDFIPAGGGCQTQSVQVACSPEGVAQQIAVGQYVMQVIPKLASGALGKSE
jgi:hypothetical protein